MIDTDNMPYRCYQCDTMAKYKDMCWHIIGDKQATQDTQQGYCYDCYVMVGDINNTDKYDHIYSRPQVKGIGVICKKIAKREGIEYHPPISYSKKACEKSLSILIGTQQCNVRMVGVVKD